MVSGCEYLWLNCQDNKKADPVIYLHGSPELMNIGILRSLWKTAHLSYNSTYWVTQFVSGIGVTRGAKNNIVILLYTTYDVCMQ